jgi:hypothetical protein
MQKPLLSGVFAFWLEGRVVDAKNRNKMSLFGLF